MQNKLNPVLVLYHGIRLRISRTCNPRPTFGLNPSLSVIEKVSGRSTRASALYKGLNGTTLLTIEIEYQVEAAGIERIWYSPVLLDQSY